MWRYAGGVCPMRNNVLVVAAHADDEVLGCGGTIARHVAENDSVQLVVLADGVGSRASADTNSLSRRTDAAKIAQKILGITEAHYLGFPDNAMDSFPLLCIVQKIEAIIKNTAPSIIYTHFHGDLNIDHRLAHQAVLTACRPQPGCCVRKIYGFEVLSSTEWATPRSSPFTPNVHIDITHYFTKKIQALEAYAEEMRPEPHSRSLKHAEVLARHRGYSVGFEYAEAFVAYRILK